MAKGQRTNNDLQNTTQTIEDRATRQVALPFRQGSKYGFISHVVAQRM